MVPGLAYPARVVSRKTLTIRRNVTRFLLKRPTALAVPMEASAQALNVQLAPLLVVPVKDPRQMTAHCALLDLISSMVIASQPTAMVSVRGQME
jgi:hypothetical protein